MNEDMPVVLNFSCGEVAVSTESVCRAMGYAAEVPTEIRESVESCMELVRANVFPEAGYVLCGSPELRTGGLVCGGQDFQTGGIIRRYLEGAEQVAVFVATAGEGMERLLREAADSGDVFSQYVLDTAGSEIAEATAELLEAAVVREAVRCGRQITNRLSPGYCGWDVAEQKKLFALLPERFCGITLSESALMHPIKSVSGIIGLGRKVEREAYTCVLCDREDCVRRRTGPRRGGTA